MKLPNRKLLALIVVLMFYGCIHTSNELSDLRVAFRNFQPNETILRLEIARLHLLNCYQSPLEAEWTHDGALFLTDKGIYYFGDRRRTASTRKVGPEHITAARLRRHWTYENISNVRIDDKPGLSWNCLVILDKTGESTLFFLVSGGSRGYLKANYEFLLEKIRKE